MPNLPRLKEWTKTGLAEKDWNLAEFCDCLECAASDKTDDDVCFHIARVFAWELDRELGSGNGRFELEKELAECRRPPLRGWECQLTLLRQNGLTIVVPIDPPFWLLEPQRRRQPLREWHIAELAHYVTPDTYSASRGTNDVCALEIPWSADEEEVVERFRLWLRKLRGYQATTRKRPGRKCEWRRWFFKLAIYRLSSAGHRHKETLLMLKRKWPERDFVQLNPANFARAKRFVRECIHRRFRELCFKAKRLEKEMPGKGMGDWQQHFLKQ